MVTPESPLKLVGDFPASNIIDDDPRSNYSSVVTDTTPWVGINLGSAQTIHGVNLTPRSGGLCFPINFTLQSSNDGVTWSTIPGQSYSSYPNPGSAVQSISFSSPVQAQYIGLYATVLGADQFGAKYPQLEQMTVQQTIPFTASARHFKITATQLTADSYGKYYFQLDDVLIDP